MTLPIAIAAAQAALTEACLRAGRPVRFMIATNSMSPFLQAGDRILVVDARPSDLRVGDIVVVQAGQTWLAHRLIARYTEDGRLFVTTKGDNCASADASRPAADLLGVVVQVQWGGTELRRNAPARWVSVWIAMLSGGEWFIFRQESGLPRTLALKLLQTSIHATSAIYRRAHRAAYPGPLGSEDISI